MKNKSKKILEEFKQFIERGNVLDLAVGVIIGGAFGKIVTSLVNDILMPIVGVFIGGLNFTNLSIKIKDASINYGMFIQNLLDFLIVAACIFLFIKAINKITRKDKKKENKEEVKKDDTILLLEEIRDLLKEKK